MASERTVIRDGTTRAMAAAILTLCGIIGAGSSQTVSCVQRSERESIEWREIRQGLIDATAVSSRSAGSVETLRESVREWTATVKSLTEVVSRHETLITQIAERQKSMDDAISDQRATARDINGKLAEMLELYNELRHEIEKGKKR